MPTYTFRNVDTEEEYDLIMSFDDLTKYLDENKNVNQVFKMNIVDPVGIGVSKPPSDFQKYVLSKVKQMPGAQKDVVEKRWQIAKEI